MAHVQVNVVSEIANSRADQEFMSVRYILTFVRDIISVSVDMMKNRFLLKTVITIYGYYKFF